METMVFLEVVPKYGVLSSSMEPHRSALIVFLLDGVLLDGNFREYKEEKHLYLLSLL